MTPHERTVKHRRWAKLRAALGGYFWLPCPLCGQFFGGHEWRERDGKSGTILIAPGQGRCICPDCTLARQGDHVNATEVREALFKRWPSTEYVVLDHPATRPCVTPSSPCTTPTSSTEDL